MFLKCNNYKSEWLQYLGTYKLRASLLEMENICNRNLVSNDDDFITVFNPMPILFSIFRIIENFGLLVILLPIWKLENLREVIPRCLLFGNEIRVGPRHIKKKNPPHHPIQIIYQFF